MAQPNKTRNFLSWLLPALITLILLPPHFFNLPQPGIDDSWNIALHLAYRYHLEFGKDFVFTFGPLGILHSRLPIAIHPLVFLFFDVYFLVSLFFLLRRVFQGRFHAGTVVFVLLTAGLVMRIEGLEDWFFFLCLFYLFSFLREPYRYAYLLQAALLAIFSFYFKLNLGVIGIFAFLAILVYSLGRKRISLGRFALSFFVFLSLFLIAGAWMHVSLGGYIRSSMQLVKDYSDAMLWPVMGGYRVILDLALIVLTGVALVVGIRLLSLLWRRSLLQNTDELFIYAMICLAFFLYFKSSFVRADGHVFQFFRAAPILIGSLFVFAAKGFPRIIAGAGCWVILALSIAAASLNDPAERLYQHLLTLSFLPQKVSDIGEYVHELTTYRAEAKRLDNEIKVPSALRVRIGGHSVDILPWDIAKIYFNGLNYAPRPVIQSYAAYDEYLDSLNADRYRSAKAPENILFSLKSIDQRFPFFDESRTKLAIIDRYRPAGYIDGELLLQKDSGLHRLIRDREEQTQVRLNQDIPIEKFDGLQFSRFYIDYDRKGQLDRLLLVPPSLKIVLTLETSDSFRYPAIKPILEDGVIINKYVEDKEEFQLLLRGRGTLTPNIRKIRIETGSVSNGFRPLVRMVTTYYRFRNPDPAEQNRDSAGIQMLYHRLKPIPLDSGSMTAGPLPYSLQAFTSFSQLIRVSGAVPSVHPLATGVVYTAVLRMKDKVFGLPTKMDGTSFSAAVAKEFLPIGDYELGLMQWHPRQEKATIRYSGLHTLIRSAYKVEDLDAGARDLMSDTGLKGHTEIAIDDGENIHIGGWSYWGAVDPNAPTFIILKGNRSYRISTDVTERPDVASYLKLSSIFCGFDVLLPVTSVAKGQYLIGLERVDREGRKRIVRFPGETISIGFTKLFTPKPLAAIPAERNFPSGLDHHEDGKDTLFLSGWAVYQEKDVAVSTISIVLKGKTGLYGCAVNPEQRSDVTAYFKSKYRLDNCGFSAKISKSGLPKGRYRIGIRVEGPNGDAAVKFLDLYTSKE